MTNNTCNSKYCLVTGASSGIGRATAISLYEAGWNVAICARRQDALEETRSLMKRHTTDAAILVLTADLGQEGDVERLFAEIEHRFGRLDMLFNNAGVPSPKRPMEEISLQEFQQVLNVNVGAVFHCCQEAIRLMKRQNPPGGRIINNGSVSAYAPRPLSAPYTISKHAILGLTRSIALDYRQYNIACSQIDIGNASSVMSDSKTNGALQADGQIRAEPTIDASYVGAAVVFLANLPLHVNILNQTLMASHMPFVGRG